MKALNNLARQSLHAYKLEFTYEDEDFIFLSDIPEGLQKVIDKL